MKRVLLLGASGSIGSQSLDIINDNKKDFELIGFSVGHKSILIDDILETHKSVKYVYLIDEHKAKCYQRLYKNIKFFSGDKGLSQITKKADYDLCVDALVGFSGLEPAINVLKRNKILCLANKEALVSGGNLINSLLEKGKGKLYPIDSEHVALAKCLSKCKSEEIDKLFITASGGALRNVPIKELCEKTAEDALKHPTWKMGPKITIDCATMMNKGFEIIEAYYLYHYPLEKIDVLMHDESLVHSLVKAKDGTYILDYDEPDMHNPIAYAMYESNIHFEVKKVKELSELNDCHFHSYDPLRYPCCELAKKCLSLGASKMVALNAANEVAVYKFLDDKIKYLDIYKIVEKIVNETKLIKNPSLRKIKKIDKESRKAARLCQC